MKKILFMLVGMMMLSSTAYAKDMAPGTISLSGGATLGFTAEDWELDGVTTDRDSWGLLLNGEYYGVPNVGLGLILEYDKSEMGGQDFSSLTVGPTLSYNHSVNETVSLPIFGGLVYASADETGMDDYTGWGWLVGTGVKYFLNDNVSLNGIIDYKQTYLEDEAELDIKGFDAYAGISVYFGGK